MHGNSGGAEMWLDSGYVLKVERMEFVDNLNMRYKKIKSEIILKFKARAS